jgi:hypothetical protein
MLQVYLSISVWLGLAWKLYVNRSIGLQIWSARNDCILPELQNAT